MSGLEFAIFKGLFYALVFGSPLDTYDSCRRDGFSRAACQLARQCHDRHACLFFTPSEATCASIVQRERCVGLSNFNFPGKPR